MTIDVRMARVLCAAGNHHLAHALLDDAARAGLDERAVHACEDVIAQTRVLEREVLFPVVTPDDPSASHLCRVELGEPGLADDLPAMDDDARGALDDAVRDAWRVTGALDDLAAARPSIALRATRALGRELRGRSLYLAVLLAVVARLSRAAPSRTIVATGHPGMALGDLDAKRALLARLTASGAVSARELLAVEAGSPIRVEPASGGLARARWVEDVEEALRLSFNTTPWAASSAVPCVHAYVGAGRDQPPTRFGLRSALPTVLAHERDFLTGRDDLDALVRRVWDALAEHPRVELSIGGPVFLAAALGWRLRNQRPEVWFVDAHDNLPWWSNQAQLSPTDAPRAVEPSLVGDDGEARIVVSRGGGGPLPAGWRELLIPTPTSRNDLPDICRRLLEAAHGAKRLHLAFNASLGVAWAVGGCVRNRFEVAFYQYVNRDYVVAFDGPQRV